jgi:PAS domain S-box-containing protein
MGRSPRPRLGTEGLYVSAFPRDSLAQIIEDIAPAVWLVDRNLRFQYFSQNGLVAFQLEQGDVAGRTPFECLPAEAADVLSEAHARALGGICCSVEATIGDTVWSVRTQPWRDEAGAICGSLARATHVDEERAEEERLRLITYGLDRSPDGAYLIRPDGSIHYVNDAASRTLGYSKQELLTMRIPEIDPDVTDEVWPHLWEDLRTKGQLILETRHKTKEGRLIDVEIVAYHFLFKGLEYDFAFARDISERIRAAEERRDLQAQILQAQKLESLGVLAGGIAHDFNNLLAVILGNANIALSELAPTSPTRELCEEIGGAARRAAELCRQMLAYSGKGRFLVEPIDLGVLVREMAQMLEIAISKKATLRHEFAEDLPLIDADATQLRQIIMNLITNASDAIEDANGIIRLKTGSRECDESYLSETYLADDLPTGPYVYVEVSDTGCGMDPETLERMFDPFFTTKFAGRGLGLAALLGIVRGHRGAIKIRTRPGEGTSIRILFPAAEGRSAPSEVQRTESDPWQGSGTLLLVDDDEDVRAMAKKMLEHLGFEVLTAENGLRALDVFQHHRGEVRCVLLDLAMPKMDGETCFHELRRLDAHLPIVLCSGYSEQDATHRFADRRPTGFVQKPFEISSMRDVLRDALDPEST